MNMLDFRLYLFLNVNLLLSVYAFIPEEKLCANSDCTEGISQARGSVTYVPDFKNGLGFKKGQEILITSKSNVQNGYWGAIINGKVGYVPSNLIKETKIFRATKTLIVVKNEPAKSDVKDKTNSDEFSLNSEIKNNINDNSISSVITENTDRNSNEVSKNSLPEQGNLNDNISTLLNSNKNDQASVLPVKPFNVIEGTTVYNDEINEILSSPATATKIDTHTAMPELSNSNKQGEMDKKNTLETEANYLGDNSSLIEEAEENVRKKSELNSQTDPSILVASNAQIENNNAKVKEEIKENKIFESTNTINLKNEALNQPDKSILQEKFEPNKANIEVIHYEEKGTSSFDDNEDDDDDGDDNKEEEEEDEEGEVEDEDGSEEPLVITRNSVSGELNSQGRIEKENIVDMNNSGLKPDFIQNDIITQNETSSSTSQFNSGISNSNTPQQLNEFLGSASNLHQEDTTNMNIDKNSMVSDINLIAKNNVEEVNSKNTISTNTDMNTFAADINSVETLESKTLEANEIIKPNYGSPILPLSSSIHVNAESTLETNNNAGNEKHSNEEFLSGWDLINNSKNNKPPSDVGEKEKESITANENNLYPTLESVNRESQKVPQTDSNFNFDNKIQNNNIEATTDSNFIYDSKLQNNNIEPTTDSNFIYDNKIQHNNFEATTQNLNENFSPVYSNLPESTTEAYKNDNPTDSMAEKIEISETSSGFHDRPDLLQQPDTSQQESNFFSQIIESITSWFNSNSNGNTIKNEDSIENNEILPKQDNVNELLATKGDILATAAPGFCEKDECTNNEAEEQLSFWNAWTSPVTPKSNNILLCLIVTAVTVLLFTLGHNFIEAKGKTGPLIAKINKLEQEFLVTSKECLLLKDELNNAREKIIMYENSANDELVVALQNELEESKKARVELENSMEVLQQELDAATEAGLDLNKMLSEVLTQKGGSESLLQSVENLQSQLNSQQMIIDEMTQKLGIKNKENETLSAALQGYQEKCESLEEQLLNVKENMDIHHQEKDDIIENLKSEIHKISQTKEQDIKKVQKNLEELKKKFTDASGALTAKEEELKILKNSVKQIKSKGNVDFEKLFDISRVKGELIKAQKDVETLSKKLQEEESRKEASDSLLKSKDAEVQQIKQRCEEAERNKEEAEKKLEVLSTYFKEKETQLQKELGLQEALWAQKKGDEKAVYSMMKSLQEEIESYKSQNETLKKEILDQERGLKNQIATLEQKAHENWVAARQAERKLEENKQETAQLRNRLTLMEKNVNNDVEGKPNHYTEELNGVEAASPILHNTSSPLLFPPLPMDPNSSSLLPPGFMPPHPMFMPPPVGGFIPPPPFLPGDRRPPPLGRMSSPPLNNRFSPPLPPDFPLGRMTSPPLSPHNRNYRSPTEADREREHFRHRTPPYPPMKSRNWEEGEEMQGFIPISSQRDSRREQKGSNVSSGHSSSDSLDQSSRHSGRV